MTEELRKKYRIFLISNDLPIKHYEDVVIWCPELCDALPFEEIFLSSINFVKSKVVPRYRSICIPDILFELIAADVGPTNTSRAITLALASYYGDELADKIKEEILDARSEFTGALDDSD